MNHSGLFPEIARVHPTLIGWCELYKAIDLAATIVALRPKVVVEVGVYGGKSLVPQAMACKAIGCGTVIGIDPWSAVASSEGYSGANAEWWGKLDHEAIFSACKTAVSANGLDSFVKIIRSKSDDVTPPDVIDLFHLDGQHSDQAIRDAERFGSRVRIGGFCFTDDDDWDGGGPKIAVKRLMEMGFVPLYKCGTGTAFQRVR